MTEPATIAADYQHYELDETGQIVGIGERMEKKLQALQATGLAPDFVAGTSVLDVGCDHGFWSFLASHAGAANVLGLDRNRDVRGKGHTDLIAHNTALAARYAKHRRVKFRRINLGAQWHEFGQFDVVFAMSVYHHVFAQCGDHASVWYWLARHTAPSGLLIWEGPTDADDCVVAKDVPHWCRSDYAFQSIDRARSMYFEVERRGPALHETTRQIWLCRRHLVLPTVPYHGVMMDGAKGATQAFLRDNGRRMSGIADALGREPVPGSLNLVLEAPFDWGINYYRAEMVDSTDRRDPHAPWQDRWCRFYPVTVNAVGGWAMRFEGERYPQNFVEVIGPHRFRDLIPGPEVALCR